MDQYEAQLLSVEQALLTTTEDGSEREELLALKDNLIELIALTQYEENHSTQPDKNEIDEEMQKFMNEIKEIDSQSQQDLKKIKDNLDAMVGEKCSAPHMHAWGSVAYHNAIICSVESEAPIDEDGKVDVQFRILFTNPTHREMLPCSYFLEGSCRFDSENCHYSHGEIVSATSLREYREPDFSRLSRNCVVLAKTEDRLWVRGRVLCANYVEKECRVRLDNRKNAEREKDFKFEDLLPIFQDKEDSSSDSGSELDYPAISAEDTNSIVNTFTYELTQPLGDWEKHTRGIGSKLMAKMGYVYGTGLGSNGRGIITPVTAQILPPGRSLDHCMELREAANGDKDLFSAEKKMQRDQRKQQALNAKAYERETSRTDVFSFINDNILAAPKPNETATVPKTPLQSHTSKSLNVESVKVADDIRRKEREIAEVQKSLKRNVNGSSEICNRLRQNLQTKTNELNVLEKQQKCLSNEQASRRTKEKLCVF